MKHIEFNKWALALACAVSLGLAPKVQAITLDLGSAEYLGMIRDGVPSDPTSEVSYINTLIGLAPGGTTTSGANTFDRSDNVFGALPTAVEAGAFKQDPAGPGVVDLGSGWQYLLGKYGNLGQEDVQQASVVWYVGGLTGTVEIPTGEGDDGLSHWSLYNPGNGNGVPDGGTSFALLGLALGGLTLLRRKLS